MIDRLRAGERPSLDALIDTFADRLPTLAELAGTEQDPGWHAEGDVHVHTAMVLDELYEALASDEGRALGPDTQLELILGALLHDVAKPLTTRRGEVRGVERVVAPRHEARGRGLVATALVDVLPWASLWHVMGMVGSHQEPKLLVVKDAAPGAWRASARRVDPVRVAWLERADMRGRRCADRAAQVEQIDLFAIGAEAWAPEGWQAPWRAFFGEALAERPLAFRDRAFGEAMTALVEGRLEDPSDATHLLYGEPEPPELVVLCGPSGSGKSTFVERTLRPAGFEVVSLDALRAELSGDRADLSLDGAVRQEARRSLKAALRPGRRVVWDATSLRRDFRAPIVQLGHDYGALVTIVVFQLSPADLHRRNRARDHDVPVRVLDQQLDRWEWPDVDEAHRLIVVDGAGRVRGAFGGCGEELPWGLPAASP